MLSRWKKSLAASFPRFAQERLTSRTAHGTGREASVSHSHAKRGNENKKRQGLFRNHKSILNQAAMFCYISYNGCSKN